MAIQYGFEASKILMQNPYLYRKDVLAVQERGRRRLSTFGFVTQAAAPVANGNNILTPLPSLATTSDGGFGPVNIADVIVLARIPAYARVTGGFMAFGAFGAGATMSLGTATVSNILSETGTTVTVVDAVHYLGATSVAAIGSANFANTLALNYLEQVTQETWLVATAGGANYANGIELRGHLDWLLD